MTGCRAILDQLPLFAGGDLDASTAAAVKAHLRLCCACRREAASLLQALKALRGAGVPDDVADAAGSADLHGAIVGAVMADVVAREGRSVALRRAARVAAAAAAALSLFLGGWWLVRSEPDPLFVRGPLVQNVDWSGPKAVPWSGGRVQLRPLGLDGRDAGGAGEGAAPGMLGRFRLRTLDAVEAPLPGPRALPGERLDRDR
ncbi:MAG: hypothetical protein FJ265_15495 [Planctomycetes bacterium]|nr:hypothetical protein [Planctomycetota bacterium]